MSNTTDIMLNGPGEQDTSHLVNGPSTTASTATHSASPSRSTTTTGASSRTDYTSISKLYTDRSVFITGGTGFMGKVLVEKLLRSCPGIKNLYLLIRPKKGQETAARLNDLLNTPVTILVYIYQSPPNFTLQLYSIHSCLTLCARNGPMIWTRSFPFVATLHRRSWAFPRATRYRVRLKPPRLTY